MYKVLMEAQSLINANNFSIFPNKIKVPMSVTFDEYASDILRRNRIPTSNVFFNTKIKHKSADEFDQIILYDYVWKDNDNNIVAFWDRRSKTLMF